MSRFSLADCAGKEAFTSATLARKAAGRKNRSTYKCTHCGHWHAGTAFNGKMDRRRELRDRDERHIERGLRWAG